MHTKKTKRTQDSFLDLENTARIYTAHLRLHKHVIYSTVALVLPISTVVSGVV